MDKLINLKEELRAASELCTKTVTNTSVVGKDALMRDLKLLVVDHEDVNTEASEAKDRLQSTIEQLKQFDESQHALLVWMDQTTATLQDTSTLATLDDKSQHVAKIKVTIFVIKY